MSNDKKSAYGTASADTAFRRTWDRDEFAAKAADRQAKERQEAKERYEAKLAGQKYVRQATPPDASDTQSREKRLDVTAQLGKTLLVPAGSATGKKGKGAGFYCQDCDMTFKDNLQWVDHLNSRLHLVKVGESGMVSRATLAMVKERLEYHKRKRDEQEKGEVIDLEERLAIRKEKEEKERGAKRLRRKEARQREREAKEQGENDVGAENDSHSAMASLMGFVGFGSTKA